MHLFNKKRRSCTVRKTLTYLELPKMVYNKVFYTIYYEKDIKQNGLEKNVFVQLNKQLNQKA